MENEYLKTDVRGDGGNSSGAVWKRGYFLSTTMEKALGPVPTKSSKKLHLAYNLIICDLSYIKKIFKAIFYFLIKLCLFLESCF